MPKNEYKPAPRSLDVDEMTVQFSVPRELLAQLSEQDDEATRVGPLPAGLIDEPTLLLQPAFASPALAPPLPPAPHAVVPTVVIAPSAAVPVPMMPVPMTPVSISDAELAALVRPQRVARVVTWLVLAATVLGAAALMLASR